MGVTVQVNGLTIAHKGSGGYEMNSAPDVCKTPPHPVPVPYSIISYNSGLQDGSTKTWADGGNSIDIKGSIHTPCTGDEPGSVGGVVSGTNVHESSWITYSPNVMIEGKNACRQTDKMFMNKKNTISGAGGNWEPTLKSNDPVLQELCKIFCKINNDGKDGKDQRGKDAAAKNSKLKKAGAVPGKQIMHPTKKSIPGPKGRPRVNWARNLGGLEKKLRDTFFANARRVLGRKLLTKGATLWTRAIPFVGWGLAAYDVYDIGSTASDMWKQYKKTAVDGLRDLAGKGYNIYEARPDIAMAGKNGATDKIYDFKFGKDKWGPGQKELYDDITGGKTVAVDQNTCKCKKKGAGV